MKQLDDIAKLGSNLAFHNQEHYYLEGKLLLNMSLPYKVTDEFADYEKKLQALEKNRFDCEKMMTLRV